MPQRFSSHLKAVLCNKWGQINQSNKTLLHELHFTNTFQLQISGTANRALQGFIFVKMIILRLLTDLETVLLDRSKGGDQTIY